MNTKAIAIFAVLAVALAGVFAIAGADAADEADFDAEYVTDGSHEGVIVTFKTTSLPTDLNWQGSVYDDAGKAVVERTIAFPQDASGKTFLIAWQYKPIGEGVYDVVINDKDNTYEYRGSFEVKPIVYTITYYVDGVECGLKQQYYYGDAIVAPEYEPDTGRIFLGWEDVPETMPAENVSVYGETALNVDEAFLHDNSGAIADDDLYETYSADLTDDAVITISATGLKAHANGQVPPAMGYWAGFCILLNPLTGDGTGSVDYKFLNKEGQEITGTETVKAEGTPQSPAFAMYYNLKNWIGQEMDITFTWYNADKSESLEETYTIVFDEESEIVGYDVTFYVEDEVYGPVQTVAYGDYAVEPKEPGATFIGWYTVDGVLFDFEAPITENLDLYAKFEPTLESISATAGKTEYFVGDPFDASTLAVTATYDDGNTRPLAADEYSYSPEGALALTNDKVTITLKDDTAIKCDVTISVIEKPVPVVTYDVVVKNGDEVYYTAEDVLEGEAVTMPEAPVAEDKFFVGYAINGNNVGAQYIVSGIDAVDGVITIDVVTIDKPVVPVDDLKITFDVATVHDNEGVYTDDEVISDYKIESTQKLDGYTLVTVTGKDLKYHTNGEGNYGYWAGIFVKLDPYDKVLDFECSKQNFEMLDVSMGTLGKDTLRKYVNLEPVDNLVYDTLYITIVTQSSTHYVKVWFDISVDEDSAYTTLTVTENFGNDTAEVVKDVPKGMPYPYVPTERVGYVPEQAVYVVDVKGEADPLTVQYIEKEDPVIPVEDLTIETAVATVHDVEEVYTDAEVISEYGISEKELSRYTLVTVTGKDLKYHMNGERNYGYWAGIFLKITNNNSVVYDYECSRQNFGGADVGMGVLEDGTLVKYVNLDVCDTLYITIVSENDAYYYKVVFDIEVDKKSARTTLTVTENFGNETAKIVKDVPKGEPYYYKPTDRDGYVPEKAVYKVDVKGKSEELTVQYEEHREPVAAKVDIKTAKLYDPVEDILEEDLIDDYLVTIDYDLFYQIITVHGENLKSHHNAPGDMGYWAGAAFICDTPGQYYISEKSFADALAGEATDFAAGTDRTAPSFAKYGNGLLHDTYVVIKIGDEMQFYKITYDVTKYQEGQYYEYMHVLYRDWLGGDRYYIYDDYAYAASGSGYFLRNGADASDSVKFLGWETEDGKLLTAVSNFDFRSGFDSKTYDRDMDAFVSDEADGLYVLTARYALTVTWITFSGEKEVQYYETGQPIECPYTEQEMQDDLDEMHPEVAPGTLVFAGWEMGGTVYTPEQVDGMPANGNYVFTASSGVASFTITYEFLNEDAEEDVFEDEVPYGGTPVPPQVPQQVSDDTTIYYFVGWDPEIGEVTGETTYTAVYKVSDKMKEVTVTVNNEAFGYFEIDGVESTSSVVSVPVDFDVATIADDVLTFEIAYLDHDELKTETVVFTAIAKPDDTRHYDFVKWEVSEDKSTYTAVFKDDILTSKDLDKILTFFDATDMEGGDVRFTINSKDQPEPLAIPKGKMTVCFYELGWNERLGIYMQIPKSCDAIQMEWEGKYGDNFITETIKYADLTMDGEAFDITKKDITVMWLVFEGINGAYCESNQATPGQWY